MALPPGWTFDMRPCPHCSKMITQLAEKCRYCKGEVAPAAWEAEEDQATGVERLLVPVGRPASAIAAGYLGLFSLLPLFGIVAIIVSIVALRTLKRKPKLSGRGRAYFGLIMGILTTLLYATPLLIALIYSLSGKNPG